MFDENARGKGLRKAAVMVAIGLSEVKRGVRSVKCSVSPCLLPLLDSQLGAFVQGLGDDAAGADTDTVECAIDHR